MSQIRAEKESVKIRVICEPKWFLTDVTELHRKKKSVKIRVNCETKWFLTDATDSHRKIICERK